MDYGLVGEKLGHSFSKEIHSKLSKYDYCLCEVAPEDIDDFFIERDFKGVNVTIPYKQTVMKHLDFISEEAKSIGAVNTVVNRNGKLYGYNTDFAGMKGLILKNGIEISGKKVLILGTGGTSNTAFAVCQSLGAKSIFKVSRSKSEQHIDYDEAYSQHSDCDVLINTTPCGMYPNINSVAIDIDCFSNLSGVVDAVYNPLSSLLVTKAKQKGIKAVGGLYMLVLQAAVAAEHFMDCKVEETRVDEIYKDILKAKRNIVLIGMPSSGKTSIGKELVGQLGMDFIDTDCLIEQKAKMSISDIFKTKGEAAFRDIEAEVIQQISGCQSTVIATGGGAVLREENVINLKLNGTVFFIDRSIENLLTTPDRPLSSNKQDLERRYNERYGKYLAVCDKRIENNGDMQSAIDIIKGEAVL